LTQTDVSTSIMIWGSIAVAEATVVAFLIPQVEPGAVQLLWK
jgi:hypothetical protein